MMAVRTILGLLLTVGCLGVAGRRLFFLYKVGRTGQPTGPEHHFDLGSAVMIGDSLSSDMQGGRNAGIPTCLYGRTEPISPLCDYAVADLLELPALLAPL